MTSKRSDRRLGDAGMPVLAVGNAGHGGHDQYHRTPAPRLRAISASTASA